MKTAAIYARVSTTQQKEEGSSLETQVEKCFALALQKGYRVPPQYIFQEDRTGATLDRPKLSEARELVRGKEVTGLIALSTDRLARNPIHIAIVAEECDKKGVELLFVTEPLDNTPEGQLIRYVRGYAAQVEREKISERTVRGKRMRALSGRIPAWASPPYGYRYVPGKGPGEGIRVVNEAEAEIVRKMFSWVVEEGVSMSAVVRRLREMNVPTSKGKSIWKRGTVGQMLANPAYIGKTYAFTSISAEPKKPLKANRKILKSTREPRPRSEWIEIPNATPAIVSERLFNAVQQRFVRNKELCRRNAKREYLLSGYVFCKICGRKYWGMPRAGIRYICTAKHNIDHPEGCPNRSWSAPILESLVWGRIESALTDPALLAELVERRQRAVTNGEGAVENLDALDRRLQSLESRERRLIRLYTYGEFDDQLLLREKTGIEKDRRQILAEKTKYEQALLDLSKWTIDPKGIASVTDVVSKKLKDTTFAAKRALLETLQVKVWVDGEKVDIDALITIPSTDSKLSQFHRDGTEPIASEGQTQTAYPLRRLPPARRDNTQAAREIYGGAIFAVSCEDSVGSGAAAGPQPVGAG